MGHGCSYSLSRVGTVRIYMRGSERHDRINVKDRQHMGMRGDRECAGVIRDKWG